MRKRFGLTKNYEFIKVYKTGRRVSGPFFTMYFTKNKLNNSRFGISVSKKVGKSVVRNKVKRRIREILRNNIENIKSGFDIIVSTKPKAKETNYQDMNKELLRLVKKGRISND